MSPPAVTERAERADTPTSLPLAQRPDFHSRQSPRRNALSGRADGTAPIVEDMAILVDEPQWPAHGRLWAHLVSDVSLGELHAFARTHNVPERAFDLDHYDVPAELVPTLVAAGAQKVTGGELVRRLIASGLRITARERRLSPEASPEPESR